MVTTPILRASIRKPGSAGLVTTTAGNDLVHTLGIGRSGVVRTAIIRKVLAYNNTGGPVTLQFGTLDLAAAFVQYLPDLVALNAPPENSWLEEELPAVEFSPLGLAGALGRLGDIYLVASAALVLVQVEVEEYGF